MLLLTFFWDRRHRVLESLLQTKLSNVGGFHQVMENVSNTLITDLPTPGKGKSGDPWKKSVDSTKNREILFFPRSNPFSKKGSKNKLTVFSLLVYHFMALVFLVNIAFLFDNLIYFISERFFPKTRVIGSLVVRPWEMTKNRETHGRTVRVGRSDSRAFFYR